MLNITSNSPYPKSGHICRSIALSVISRPRLLRAEKAWDGVPLNLCIPNPRDGRPRAKNAMTRHVLRAVLGFFLAAGAALTAAEPTGRIEQATPAIKRFVGTGGFEVSFANTWRILQRQEFDLFLDQLGGPGEAATLSIGSINVAPKAREAIAADLAANEPRMVTEGPSLIKHPFPGAQNRGEAWSPGAEFVRWSSTFRSSISP